MNLYSRTALMACVVCSASFAASQTQMVSPPKNLGTPRPVNPKLLRNVVVPPSNVVVPRKTALPRNIWLLTDTGKAGGRPVDPNQRIQLDGRRSLTAKELIDGTNELENSLNGLGYSLYTDGDETQPIIGGYRANVRTDLTTQARALARFGGRGLGPAILGKNFTTSFQTILNGPPIVIKGQNKGRIKVIDPEILRKMSELQKYQTALETYEENVYKGPDFVHREFAIPELDFGDPAWFGVSLRGGLVADGNLDKRSSSANLDVTASILNQKIVLLHGLAEARSTQKIREAPRIRVPGSKDTEGGIRLEVQVLGEDIISPVNMQTAGTVALMRPEKAINWEYGVTIPIIPGINAVGTFGAKGKAGVEVSATANGMGNSLSVSPFIESSVYAQAGISVGFAIASIEGGVGAELTLINYKMNFSVGVDRKDVIYNGIKHHAIVVPIEVSHDFNALSGRVYGYARIGYWLPFSTRHKMLWQGDLIKWPGVTDNRTLYAADYAPVIIAPVASAKPTPPKS